MAKITVVGDAVVITSKVKLEDIKTIQKLRPRALQLRGGEDGKELLYSIAAGKNGTGEISKIGAVFDGTSRDGEGLATITLHLTAAAEEDVKEVVADQIGGALMNLNKLEATLPPIIADIANEKAQVLESISVQ